MNKTSYFLEQSEIYFKNGFYPDALSRRYYALLHMMVDFIEKENKHDYDRKHKDIRNMFVEKLYGDKGHFKGRDIKLMYDARVNADYKRDLEEQFSEKEYIDWYNIISKYISEIQQEFAHH